MCECKEEITISKEKLLLIYNNVGKDLKSALKMIFPELEQAYPYYAVGKKTNDLYLVLDSTKAVLICSNYETSIGTDYFETASIGTYYTTYKSALTAISLYEVAEYFMRKAQK